MGCDGNGPSGQGQGQWGGLYAEADPIACVLPSDYPCQSLELRHAVVPAHLAGSHVRPSVPGASTTSSPARAPRLVLGQPWPTPNRAGTL